MGIIESVQQYDLNIPAGGAQAIDVAGDRVQFLSAVDPFAQIEIRPNFAQGNISLKPGQGFKFSEQVTRWVVFNRGCVALSGYLLIGSGDFFDQRIAGTVDVIDGGKARTLGQVAFWGSAFSGASVGNISAVQLWNPAGSGKRLVIEQVGAGVWGGVDTAVHIGIKNTALSTAGNVPQSKLGGGAASVAQTFTQQNAGSLFTPMVDLYCKVMDEKIIKLSEPIVLPPGYGCCMDGGLTNQGVSGNWEYYEEAI